MATEQLETSSENGRTSHEDSATLMGVYGKLAGSGGGSSSVIGNSVTGIGTGRDPSSYAEVNSNPYILSHVERCNLYRNSRICQNIVNVYPKEARWGNFNIGTSRYTGEKLHQVAEHFQNNLKTGSLYQKFVEASIEARLHGKAFLMLGVNDGKVFTQPIDEQNILDFEWAQVRTYEQVRESDKDKDLYEVTLDFTTLSDYNAETMTVHKSRMLEFTGEYLPDSIYRVTKNYDSSLQAAYDGFSMAMQALLYSNAMLADHSLFWYKLDGLANLIKQKRTDEIYSRFLSLQMGKSVLKGLAMDAKTEEAGFIQRQYGGVDKILETTMDFMVAETGMVRYKVLGTASRAGLGAEGRGLQDRLEHSARTVSWANFTWKDNLTYCFKLYLLSKSGLTKGKLPQNFSVSFPPNIELTPLELAELQAKNIDLVIKAKDAGLIHRHEARMALFSSSEPVITVNVILDDRYTALLEEELELETDTIPTNTLPESDNEPDDEDDEDSGLDDVKNEFDTNFDSDETEFELDYELKLDLGSEALKNSEGTLIGVKNPSGIVSKLDALYGVWFSGRNTATVVEADSRNEAISKARRKKVAGSNQPIKAARPLKGTSLRQANKGNWIRERASGKMVHGKAPKGESPKYRPQFNTKSDDDKPIVDDPDNPVAKFKPLKIGTKLRLETMSDIDLDKISSALGFTSTEKASKTSLILSIKKRIESKSKGMLDLVESLFNDSLGIDDFILSIADDLKDLHILEAARIKGGDLEFDKDEVKILSGNIAEQFTKGRSDLDNSKFGLKFLADDLTDKTSKLELTNRVQMFSDSRKKSYFDVQHKLKLNEGDYTQGLRILGKGEHCPECVEYAARGWQEIDKIIMPTQKCTCAVNCNCSLLYR